MTNPKLKLSDFELSLVVLMEAGFRYEETPGRPENERVAHVYPNGEKYATGCMMSDTLYLIGACEAECIPHHNSMRKALRESGLVKEDEIADFPKCQHHTRRSVAVHLYRELISICGDDPDVIKGVLEGELSYHKIKAFLETKMPNFPFKDHSIVYDAASYLSSHFDDGIRNEDPEKHISVDELKQLGFK